MNWQVFELKTFSDQRGSLTPIELSEFIDFEPKRIYTVHHNLETRGGHSHYTEKEFFVMTSGTCTAQIHDGNEWQNIKMEANKQAIFVGQNIWHQFTDFSQDGVLLALSSTKYNPERVDYLENFEEFLLKYGNK